VSPRYREKRLGKADNAGFKAAVGLHAACFRYAVVQVMDEGSVEG
jgi:hypothetical protein